MIALAFSLAYAGFLALCLAMSRHYREVMQRPLSARTALILRSSGGAALAGSFVVSVKHSGGPVGAVLWVALLTVSAGSIAWLLSYAPHRMLALASALLPLSLIAALSGF